MNKRKILLSLVIASIVIASATVIYAFTSKIDLANLKPNDLNSNEVYICVSEKETDINNSKRESLIEKADKYISTFIKEDNKLTSFQNSNQSNSMTIKTFHDNSINEDYYDIITTAYTISMSESENLRAFSDNTFNYDLTTTSNKSEAKDFIINFYNNLDISHDYELAYLEVFDDSMWEADFVKKVDGIYNYYDSIKILFSPEQEKIAALRIHNTSYNNTTNTMIANNSSITELDAKNIVKDNFTNIKDNEIINTELVYTKPNNYFTREIGSDVISENIVKKAWKVTVEQDSKTTYIYIDSASGNIIGGDQIK